MARAPATATATATPSSSMASTIRAYSLPLILFAGAMYYQLFVIPKSFPPSHYDVLRIERYSSVEKVKEAYEKFESEWNSAVEAPDTLDVLKIRYAYELLTNPLWKRDYDVFGIDEQLHIIETASKHYAGKNASELDFPLLDVTSSESIDHSYKIITASDFQSLFPDTKPWIIQLYSSGSKRCVQFSEDWKKIASLLDTVANIGMVELGEVQLSVYLADKRSTGRPFFRNGIPSLVAIPPGCQTANCITRFDGELTVDKVTNWFATTVLDLPQILYYSKETLVKVIFFLTTGERASPFIRQAAKDYWAYASFAFILWREEESSYWWGAFGVESGPAIVFLKDPGTKPVVHHGSVNNTVFLNLMENNKQQELRQLRSVTSMEQGCDPRGYSRAGYDTVIWYCAIAVGRLSPELNKMRETICRVQDILSKHGESEGSYEDQSLAPAVDAFKRKRLTFTWLDGEKQEEYCHFYLGPAASHDTCGRRRGVNDVPRLFIIRYLRNSSYVDKRTEELTKWNSLLYQDLINDRDHAGQFVAKYNGADDISQITKWIAGIIADGDSRDLPFFTLKTPRLVEDDTEPVWTRTAQKIPLKNMKQRVTDFVTGFTNYLEDPRIGPILLLGALISLGTIWLRRSQQAQPTKPDQPSSEELNPAERRQRRRDRLRKSNKNQPASMTDFEPSNAYQLLDSDSE
ncbi:DnaJ like subfamily C member 10 [Senna tora]|uniref:DnaJ like subfamily C member 10 n=1 Tax=Senna tora TaxID=362788 RepID=A0A834X6S6_9FABA|nr:DnaJ like subfamily C member 10 [Senna tora]